MDQRQLPEASAEVDFDPAAFPIKDEQVVEVDAPAVVLFDRVRRIGGDVGWYYADALWRIRGGMDRLIGGVGLRRGRRDPVPVWIGRRHRLLAGRRLRARPPAAAARRDEGPRRRLAGVPRPAAGRRPFRADPDGLLPPLAVLGPRCYWYALYPVHEFIFRGMARNIARAAEREARAVPTPA